MESLDGSKHSLLIDVDDDDRPGKPPHKLYAPLDYDSERIWKHISITFMVVRLISVPIITVTRINN